MPERTKRLLDLTAGDLMSRDVVSIPRQMSLRCAARYLNRAQVRGAPVTDEDGRCIGVLSMTDVMHWLEGQDPTRRQTGAARCFCCDWQESPDELPPDAVERYMTADPVTASVGTHVGELARWMLDAQIHRIIVTDDQCRPVGVVSGSDILAALAQEDARARGLSERVLAMALAD